MLPIPRTQGRQRTLANRIDLPHAKQVEAMQRVKPMQYLVRLCLISALLVSCCFQHTTSRTTTSQKPWLNKQLPVPERVEALLKTLTLARKIPQTYAVHTSEATVQKFLKNGLGAAKYGSVTKGTIKKTIAERNKMQRISSCHGYTCQLYQRGSTRWSKWWNNFSYACQPRQ